VARANAERRFSSFDEVRIYFEPWEAKHVVAMSPESLIEAPPISVKIVGFSRAPRVAELRLWGRDEESR
jgi:hypothetical protein